jgi:hypothetical protein
MFGLEDNKKKKEEAEFTFDLEKDMSQLKRQQEYKKTIEEKVGKIKQILRSGENKEQFDHFGELLHGYASLLKVISRIKAK